MRVHGAPRRLRSLPSWLLNQAAAAASRATAAVFDAEGMHRSQFAVLAALDEFGPLSQAALSDRTGLDPSDVVRWVDELAGTGHVERARDPSDRRRNVISLTDSGRERLRDLDEKLERAQQELLAPLTAAQRDELTALLQGLLAIAD